MQKFRFFFFWLCDNEQCRSLSFSSSGTVAMNSAEVWVLILGCGCQQSVVQSFCFIFLVQMFWFLYNLPVAVSGSEAEVFLQVDQKVQTG